jgi:hypothetical protein
MTTFEVWQLILNALIAAPAWIALLCRNGIRQASQNSVDKKGSAPTNQPMRGLNWRRYWPICVMSLLTLIDCYGFAYRFFNQEPRIRDEQRVQLISSLLQMCPPGQQDCKREVIINLGYDADYAGLAVDLFRVFKESGWNTSFVVGTVNNIGIWFGYCESDSEATRFQGELEKILPKGLLTHKGSPGLFPTPTKWGFSPSKIK